MAKYIGKLASCEFRCFLGTQEGLWCAKYIGKLAFCEIRCFFGMQIAQFHQQEVLRGYSVMAHTLAVEGDAYMEIVLSLVDGGVFDQLQWRML
ncbi:MAG: hypothetical protein II798_02890 [Lachnospiraceae bacterium]|nr:hypothetical protein [Lachnospiraceae bacterium]